ncbi:DciA family protein [Methyloprofundus sp.]|uniref:DciA family protein n=1 Tax=Methyloprofundus sp. TaxID=2020875 RepID=UPI003D0F7423
MSFKAASTYSHSSAIKLQLIKHQRILRIVQAASPKQLRAHIKDCVINNNSLMIYVNSAAWASQLRFCVVQIQQAVNAQSNERINKTRVRVLSPEPFKIAEQETKVFPSEENINLLRDNAESLTEGKLKDALLGLSKALKKHNR